MSKVRWNRWECKCGWRGPRRAGVPFPNRNENGETISKHEDYDCPRCGNKDMEWKRVFEGERSLMDKVAEMLAVHENNGKLRIICSPAAYLQLSLEASRFGGISGRISGSLAFICGISVLVDKECAGNKVFLLEEKECLELEKETHEI